MRIDMDWIKGNIPSKYDLDFGNFYWVAVNNGTTIKEHFLPVIYSKGGRWVDCCGTELPIHTIVAYSPINNPKPYGTIGSGKGYYIKTDDCNGEKIFLSTRLRNVDDGGNARHGYMTKQGAIGGAERLVKLDIKNNIKRNIYQIVDGKQNVIVTVWKRGEQI